MFKSPVRLLAVLALVLVVTLAIGFSNSHSAGNSSASTGVTTSLDEGALFQHLTDNDGYVKKLDFNGTQVTVTTRSGATAQVGIHGDADANQLMTLASKDKIDFSAQTPSSSGSSVLGSLLGLLFPLLLLGGLFFLMTRGQRMAGQNGANAMDFLKHRGKRVINSSASRITFADVTGCDEAKLELDEVVQYLKNPGKFRKLGARIPRGVLLVGPPGTGKTLLAKAVAGEANCTFFRLSGSEFVEMFVGVGAGRVRGLFDEAKKNSPAIIFIDEIDAVGRQRGAGLGGGNDEREQTLNQILVEMDGFEKDTNVIVIAATNRPDVLDPALLRPGRFDRQVVVDRPDLQGRRDTFALYTRNKPLAADVDLNYLAKSTTSASQADIANICNEAALLAGRRISANAGASDEITLADFDSAITRATMGIERRRRLQVMSDKEKQNTAVHETGHAVAKWVRTFRRTLVAPTLRKITIIPTTKALGYVETLPEDNGLNQTKEELEDFLVMGHSGRVAQELLLDTVDTGAVGDNGQMWEAAHNMVAVYNMSPLGLIYAPRGEEHPFLGRTMANGGGGIGSKLQDLIDVATMEILQNARKESEEIIAQYEPAIREITELMLERETVLGPEFDRIMLSVVEQVEPDLYAKYLETQAA